MSPILRDEKKLVQVEHVLDALNCGGAVIDLDGIIFHANPRLCEMFGHGAAELVGRNVREFYDAQADRSFLDHAMNRAQPRDYEFVLPRPDGSRLPVLVSARPLPPPLQALQIVTLIDISQQKLSEADLRESVAAITQVGDSALEHALELKDYSEELERKVQQRTEDLRNANLDAIYMLAVASEAKDADTGRHVRRIQRFAEELARAMGLGETEAVAVGYSSILHDVGKIHIPDEILKKPGPLDDDERFTMKQHTLFGERILSKRKFFDRARRIARSHHENVDGSGYPDGLSKDEIPLDARIVRVVDVYDALTQPRVYKAAWSQAEALDFIAKSAGQHFDTEVAKAFQSLANAGALDRLSVSLELGDD